MKGLITWLAVAVAAPAAVEGQPEDLPPIPTAEVQRARGRIVVDGVLDEQEWAGAVPIELTYWWPQQEGPKQPTTVRLLWDDEALYFGFHCVDADITAHEMQRDDPTYRDDCCELFLTPDPDRRPTTYIGCEMNARAVMYDYLAVHGAVLAKRYQLDRYDLAVSLDGTLNVRGDTDRSWSLELKLPWSNLSDDFFAPAKLPPAVGTRFRAQLNRWDGQWPETKRALALWSHSGHRSPNPHNPERFGWLVLAGEQASD